MDNFNFHKPTAYYFGAGRENEVGSIVKNLKVNKVFVIYGGGSCVRSGLLQRVEKSLAQEGIEFVSKGGVEPNPRADLVYEMIDYGREQQVDFVLAVGGGSVIDTAKAVAIGILDNGDFFDFFLQKRAPTKALGMQQVDFVLAVGGGSVIDTAKAVAIGILDNGDFFDFFLQKRAPTKALGIGVVLTIPAAGSEGSNSAVIQKEVDGNVLKCGLSHAFNVPVFSILNPELTKTLPAYQTACGVVDMMAHVMERYFTNTPEVSITDRTPVFSILNPELTKTLPAYQTACGVVDMMAHVMERYFTNTPEVSITDRTCEAVLCSIVETAPRVIHDPNNYEARANIMWAGTLAHNDICGVGREQDWATHALEHQLSALYDVAHGAGLAVMFPAWMEYTMAHNPMRFAQFASRVFGVSMDFEDPKRTAKAGIVALRSFFKSLGMPLNFEQIGASIDDIPKLLKLLYLSKKSVGNFVHLTPEDCEAIYKIAATYKD